MPTYTYRRPDGTTFDLFQKISEDALTEDPETGQPVQRVISGGAGLQFKGDGFYVTDYVRKSAPSSESKASEGSEGSTKTEPSTKPSAASSDD